MMPADTFNASGSTTDISGVESTTEDNALVHSSVSPTLQKHLTHCVMVPLQNVTPWDNADSLVSAGTEELVHRLTYSVILPILFLIGGPANVINMAVFCRQGLKERINVCLFALSLADLMYLVNGMLLYAEQIPDRFTTKSRYGPIMGFMFNNNLIGFYGFCFVGEVISAIIASERCFCILQPLRSKTVMSASTTTAIIVMVYVVVVGLFFLVASRYRVMCIYHPVTSAFADTITTTAWVPYAGQFYLNHQKSVDILDSFVFGAGIPTVSAVVVVVTTAVTLVQIRKAAAWRAGTSSNTGLSAREVSLTMMLVYNSIFFVVCVLPLAIFRLVMITVPEMNVGRQQHNLFFTFLWLLDVIIFINSTFNFFIYYSMGSRYRHTLWTMLGRGRGAGKGLKDQKTTATNVASVGSSNDK